MTTRHRRRLREAQVADNAAAEALAQTCGRLALAGSRIQEAGRVLSAANEDKLRTAQSAIEAVLASLADDNAEPAAKESALRMAEAYSAAASDASTGAYLVGQLLDLMSEESDEPGELAVLGMAFQALTQWIVMEVSTIGNPEDCDDSEEGDPMSMFGWESVRKRLEAEPISAPEADAPAMVKCPTCEGSGKIRAGNVICPDCKGDGEVKKESRSSVQAPAPVLLREGRRLVGDFMPLLEAAVKEDGSTNLKLIQPGWGSTGYYSPEVLEAGAGVFPAGTKMFWDHPTISEEWERPERSLRDLAAELTSDAVWNASGPAGAGLYASARVFPPFREVLNEIAPSIGVSIVAYGKAESGTAEGKSGQLITELVAADSVDFVTYPGAGGQVLSLFEAARQRSAPIKETSTMSIEVVPNPKLAEAEQRAARAEEALALREAADLVGIKLAESTLPEITRKRLAETLAANPPAKAGALDKPALVKRIDEAIVAEVEYLANLREAGAIRGMGTGAPINADQTPKLEAAFVGLGMSEAAAKIAAAGRI